MFLYLFGLLKSIRALALHKLRVVKRRFGVVLADPFVTVGRHTYGVVPGKTILRASKAAPVTIGNFCSISAGVVIIAHAEHPIDLPSTFPFRTLMLNNPGTFGGFDNRDAVTKGPVDIGHDVWIGQNSIILSGIRIGSGAVIAAGAVVTRHVEPYSIVAGNPARHLRFRFAESAVSRLLSLEWWALSDDSLARLEPAFYAKDIDAFISAVEAEKARGQ